MVKNLPAMQETQVRFQGQEEPPGEGYGNSLQYSCLENPMDRGGWQATVHGVAKESDTTERLIFSRHKTWGTVDDPCPQEMSCVVGNQKRM